VHAEPAAVATSTSTSHARLAQKEAQGLAWGDRHVGDRHDGSAEGMGTSTATTSPGAGAASAAQPVTRHSLCINVGEYEGAETLQSLCPCMYSTDSHWV